MHYLCVVVVVEVVYRTMIPFGRRQHTVIDHISASLARMDALLSDLKIQATAASDQHCGLCCGCRSGIHNDDFIFEALRDGPSLKHYTEFRIRLSLCEFASDLVVLAAPCTYITLTIMQLLCASQCQVSVAC